MADYLGGYLRPRICMALGVEDMEEFRFEGMDMDLRVNCQAEALEWRAEGDEAWCAFYRPETIFNILFHPEKVKFKPRWTVDEVRDVLTIQRLFGGEEGFVKRTADGRVVLVHKNGLDDVTLSKDMFPSLRPGDIADLEAIRENPGWKVRRTV